MISVKMHPFEQRIEIGPWFNVGQRLGPFEAHSHLISYKKKVDREKRQYCIYVHVPFCLSRCEYCALYTFAVKKERGKILDEYLDMVKKSILSHPNVSPPHPPTTVHFGGGTPLFLGVKRFSHLIDVLRNTFGDSPQCEWAVETTTSSINSEILSALKQLRVERIHLGIQTLDNKIRKKIKRRETAEKAVEKINLLNSNGFVLSVDLIIGFDDQTEVILNDDLQSLYDAGIRMFSICELRCLQPRETNSQKYQEEIKRNYELWCVIWDFMEKHKIIPIHLGQFGRSYKDNLYYTHPARGEDCISIGPYAHGSAGRMVYGNKLLPEYYEALRVNHPPIDFGVVYSDEIQKIRALESQLLAHYVHQEAVEGARLIYHGDFENIWNFWLENELLLNYVDEKHFKPSRDGSWYIGNMIFQLRQLAEEKRV
jgi:coproporphyrinogen III oxidase-like Fe-S oxidoreductase